MIQILTTGGTIDKTYNPLTGELIFVGSYIEEMLRKANIADVSTNYQIESILEKDSLEMTDVDRELIYDACKNSTCETILITHGTDTMTQTAEFLSTITNKTIVLFGAMIPYSIQNSDALFNIGYATACAQQLDSGVYIAMNGKVFSANNVIKNRVLGQFENI